MWGGVLPRYICTVLKRVVMCAGLFMGGSLLGGTVWAVYTVCGRARGCEASQRCGAAKCTSNRIGIAPTRLSAPPALYTDCMHDQLHTDRQLTCKSIADDNLVTEKAEYVLMMRKVFKCGSQVGFGSMMCHAAGCGSLPFITNYEIFVKLGASNRRLGIM